MILLIGPFFLELKTCAQTEVPKVGKDNFGTTIGKETEKLLNKDFITVCRFKCVLFEQNILLENTTNQHQHFQTSVELKF